MVYFSKDATMEEPGKMGRLVNHSVNGNSSMKLEYIDGLPILLLRANQHISAGAVILYHYGDRSPQSLLECPWLKE